MQKQFDVIVIGAGHAGLEATFAVANMGSSVALITLNEQYIADTPCNPSIGGPAKGIVVREIDALGGMQAKAADACQLQMKLLNSAKGAGVWALRAQIDKIKYHNWFLERLNKHKNITLIISEVKSLIVENQCVKGVVLADEKSISSTAVIVTTGTYLKPICYIGDQQTHSGPYKQKGSNFLSNSFVENNIKLIRLKTGTPPRILNSSIDYTSMKIEGGSNEKLSFEHYRPFFLPYKKQEPCYLIHTNETTHKIIKDNLSKSAMYSNRIHSIGPRYCPSIEDKIVRFADKPRHQLFIEPESLLLDTVYLQGLSTSFDWQTQEKIVKSITGLEKAKIIKYGYAIEYDAIDPTQLSLSYELKEIKNLFFAGQINGTSGYEEAAAQGLMAGINACLKTQGKKPLVLKRTESYIGVLTDDIITKGVIDPYRLLTSRAEHRLYLRNDNAQDRLINYGYKVGLVKQKVYDDFVSKTKKIRDTIKFLKENKVNKFPKLKEKYKNLNNTLYQLIKRPEVSTKEVLKLINKGKNLPLEITNKLDIQIKFEGYIKNQEKNISKISKLAIIDLNSITNYKEITHLSLEAIDKLNRIKPVTLEQASRISGINLTDIAIIKYYIDNKKKND